MEGRQPRLIGRLLGRLRGDHKTHSENRPKLEQRFSLISTGTSEGTGCTANMILDEDLDIFPILPDVTPADTTQHQSNDSSFGSSQYTAAANDLRYSGQCLTPEQLPEFCDQLHNLVEVLRNIQSYAKVTGEYPSALERRLEHEAREVAALAAEAKNALDVINRTRSQRCAVREQRKQLASHLAALKETEVRELETTVRMSDRKLFKSWEALKDSNEPSVFRTLTDEIRTKQSALECLNRLIENRCATLRRATPTLQPLPAPTPQENNEGNSDSGLKSKRGDSFRRGCKRKRKDREREPRSVPLSGEPSRHAPNVGPECTSRYRVGSAGTVTITPLDLPSRGSVRDILFFTAS